MQIAQQMSAVERIAMCSKAQVEILHTPQPREMHSMRAISLFLILEIN